MNDKFKAVFGTRNESDGKTNTKGKSGRFDILEDAMRFYNKLVIEKFGLDEKGNPVGKVHVIPNTITYVKDLYNRRVLTEEKIKNAGKMELQSILAVNPDWMTGILSDPKNFPRNALEPHRKQILKYYLAQKT